MKWLMLPATVALAGGVSGVADAKPATPAHARAYERVYRQVAHKLGHRAPGRDIVTYGTGDHRRPTDTQTLSSLGVLQRMLAPANDTTTGTPSAAASGAGAGDVPGCASESGSDYSTGPDNTNNVLALAFGVLIVGIVIAGSLWIMYHLNANMMVPSELMDIHRQQ